MIQLKTTGFIPPRSKVNELFKIKELMAILMDFSNSFCRVLTEYVFEKSDYGGILIWVTKQILLNSNAFSF